VIAWFARNPVAANVLVAVIVFAGLHAVSERIIFETFPEFSFDMVEVSLSYRGATPAEIEEGLIIKVEEAIADLVGVKEVRSTAQEGSGTVSVEVEKGVDPRVLLDDIKGRVDAIATFPEGAEKPIYRATVRRREVIGVIVSGDLPELELRRLGERVRLELLALPECTQVELTEVRPFEIAIELSEETLDRYGLTFDEVATAISRSSLDLPAGSLKTRAGELRLRSTAQGYSGEDFAKLPIIQSPDGGRVSLGQLATIRDGFEEEAIEASFNGKRCVVLEVYRVGTQNAIELARQVREYVESSEVAPGAELKYWRDSSVTIRKRLDTLYRNAFQGAILVFVVLGLFLRPTIALWVCFGIPISFLGVLALMPIMGITINLISVFGFILVLGIVVDDAIVTAENITTHLEAAGPDADPTEIAIAATEEVGLPVTFGVLTTVVAFAPLLVMEGMRAAIFSQIPYIVVPVLLVSLLESKFVLPTHIALHPGGREAGPIERMRRWVSNSMEFFAKRIYQPILIKAVWARYLSLALFIVSLALITAYVGSGQTRFVFFPRVESETIRATLLMPEGTSFELTRSIIQRMTATALALQQETRDPSTGVPVIEDILATAGSNGNTRGRPNTGRVTVQISAAEDRTSTITAGEIVQRWREAIGPIPGVRELSFQAEIGRGGAPIDIQIKSNELELARGLAERVKSKLRSFAGIFDVADSFQEGQAELRLRLRPDAEGLGLSQLDLARQVRQGFFGADVQRIQRGRDDVRVSLRFPAAERDSLDFLETMKVRAANGVAVPFAEVASIERAQGFATISRVSRERVLSVTADIDKDRVDMPALVRELRDFLDAEVQAEPRLRYSFEGELKEQRESFNSLIFGLIFVLVSIYVLLAIPFKSYLQPLVVMAVIPFGWAGAINGHQMLGLDLSFFSVLGILALTGVVVNDSLVLVDFINRAREEGRDLLEAIHDSGVARFRAVMLTSLTTFAGLAPLLTEKSTQAQFLIPMAVSLAFGVMISTFVTLLLVPVGYMILEDLLILSRIAWTGEIPSAQTNEQERQVEKAKDETKPESR
jgi:multidrug efflux pump subunit AcrB